MSQTLLPPSFLALCLLLGSACATDPLDVPCPQVSPGDLVITEIHGPQSGTDQYGEWVEIYNASAGTVDLAGLAVTITALDGSKFEDLLVRKGLNAGPGEYVVLGRQPTGSEPEHVNYGYTQDVGARMYDSAALELSSCGELIDQVIYRNLPSRGSMALDGAIDPPNATDNDNDINWCIDDEEDANSETFGIRGTPQEANKTCEP